MGAALAGYHMLETGVLPNAGGWHDQPETFVRACEVVNAERAAITREQQAKSESLKRG